MNCKALSLFGVVAGLLLIAGPVSAHHGTAAYETNKFTTIKGTVTDYQFMNPHSEILIDVKDASGKVAKWVGEAGSVTSMTRKGWTRNLLKPGDEITMIGNRAKNGSTTMRLSKIVLANGKEYLVDRAEDYAN
jgi:hypothetical protein